MLSRAGLRDDPVLAHSLGEQSLAQAVVDLVCACVQQVLALQVNACAAQLFGEPLGIVERCRTPRVIVKQIVQFRLERGILPRFQERILQFLQRRHQHFRNELSTVGAKVPTACRL
jgi:hypothetical protein